MNFVIFAKVARTDMWMNHFKKSYARSLTDHIDTDGYGYADLRLWDAILEYVSSVLRELTHNSIEDGVNNYQISESYVLQMCFRHENIELGVI